MSWGSESVGRAFDCSGVEMHKEREVTLLSHHRCDTPLQASFHDITCRGRLEHDGRRTYLQGPQQTTDVSWKAGGNPGPSLELNRLLNRAGDIWVTGHGLEEVADWLR